MNLALDRRKLITFGLLGALGCLAGWLVGEGFLALALPRVRSAPSLASRPTAAPLAMTTTSVPPPPLPDASQFAGQEEAAVAVPPPLPMAVQALQTAPDSLFAFRTAPNRTALVSQLGGNELSETAVQGGLDWLARHQADDGFWSDQRKCESMACRALSYNRSGPIAETGLAVLAFQAGGHYYFNDHPYSSHVRAGLDWLVAQQGEDGRLFGPLPAGHHDSWYSHGIGTFALAEACAVDLASQKPPDNRYREAAARAVKFLTSHQYTGGGWQYALDGNQGDTSVTGWQVLALKSALEARLDVPPETMPRVQAFFELCGDPMTGRTGYMNRGGGTDLTTAVGLIVQNFVAKQPRSALAVKAAESLRGQAVRLAPSADFYTLYNATLAMFLAGGEHWEHWNSHVRDAIVKRQHDGGCERGSWTGPYSRTLSTAWAVLTLEVYYRYAREQPAAAPSLQLAVLPEVQLTVGTVTPVKARLGRDRVTGPVRLRCEGELSGISVAEVEVTEEVEMATLSVKVDEGVAAGKRQLRIIATANDGQVSVSEEFHAQLAPPPAALHVSVSPEVVLLPGTNNGLRVRLARVHLAGPVQLTLEGELHDLVVSESEVAAEDDEASLSIAAVPTATAGQRTLQLVARCGDIATRVPFELQIKPIPPVLYLSVPPEVTVNPGSSNLVPVLVGRERFTGPMELRVTDIAAGLTLSPAVLSAEATSSELQLTADAEMKPGKHSVVVEAVSGPFRATAPLAVMIAPPPPFPWSLALVIGLWTGLLAIGLSLALAAGQTWYLSRRLPRWQTLATLVGGGLLAGAVAGGLGQVLFSVLASTSVLPQIGFLVGWVLLGGLLGRGVGFFIPNLHGGKSAVAGAAGGLVGAAVFLGVSVVGDFAGRALGAALLGISIGLVVALVEAAFRDAWLEVRYSSRETRTVNLGTQPVLIGGDSSCTIWTPQVPGVAYRFWVEQGRVTRQEVATQRTQSVDAGHRDQIGTLEIVVRTGRSARAGAGRPVAAPPPPPPPPPPSRRAPPAAPMAPTAPPVSAAAPSESPLSGPAGTSAVKPVEALPPVPPTAPSADGLGAPPSRPPSPTRPIAPPPPPAATRRPAPPPPPPPPPRRVPPAP
ncbi:MAG: prenyltransferase/squalene oxidase repeat-containing protein [Pirellulales bacterium]